MEQKRILILTADAGFGHRSAAEAVKAALCEIYGEQCDIIISNPLESPKSPKFIQQLEEGYDEMVVEHPHLYRFSYKAMDAPVVSDVVKVITTQLLNESMQKLLTEYQPGVVVSTYPLYADPMAKAINDAGIDIPLVVVITDLTDVQNLWYSRSATLHFAPTTFIRQQAMDNNIPATRILVTGLPVHPAFLAETRSPGLIRKELGWDEHLPVALIIASARTQHMARITTLLGQAPIDLQITLVCGGDQELHEELKNAAWQKPVHIYDWTDQMPQFMKASDFVITKAGGLVISESLAAGLPIIISNALPGQEEGNVKYVIDNNAGSWAPTPEEVVAVASSWVY